ncbi:RNA polymerase sigma factor [Arthrobacter sp. N199823]|uniref:RNA polymerase sigma factor n=1 Tax=Arthrobacter sp. N199823 TaxID=2058895 RepID=UPI000CE2B957|nr:RNA polymerase sigma factor [Arthrobacter sp. N199823]
MPAPSDAAAVIPEQISTALPPFEVLITHHGAAVLRVCRALVGPTDADDVWQETFLAALRVYPSTGSVRNREAWLVTIARNKAMDHHRKAARLPLPDGGPGSGEQGLGALTVGEHGVDEHGAGETGHGGGDVVVRSVEAGETAAAVWAALATLTPMQREAVVYHHLAGLRYAEVAGILGNSEAAARRAAADGMRALRALLDHERTQKQ